MNIPDELLAAYVDGELKGAERARIEQAILHDTRLAQRVARYRATRTHMRNAFDGMLRGPVPQRLMQAARSAAPGSSAQIIDLARVRAERKRRSERHRFLQSRRTAIAASLLGGLLAGLLVEHMVTDNGPTVYHRGALLARGSLADALNEQLGGTPAPASDVRVGMSFKARDGDYCRTFSINDGQSLSGLACHEQNQWRLETLLAAGSTASSARLPATGGAYTAGGHAAGNAAGAALSPALLQTVRQRISGRPLDAEAEAKARSNDWR